jgi:hypothetical protein
VRRKTRRGDDATDETDDDTNWDSETWHFLSYDSGLCTTVECVWLDEMGVFKRRQEGSTLTMSPIAFTLSLSECVTLSRPSS